MKKLSMLAVAFLFVAGLSTTAKAYLPPVGADDTFFAAFNGGLAIPVVGTVASTPVFTGDLYETVYSDPTGLLFEYQFTNTSALPLNDNVDIITAFNFKGYITSLGDSQVSAGVAPDVEYNGGNGDVNYVFTTGGVAPGQSSDILWVQTNAPAITAGDVLIQDHGQTQVGVYGPAGAPITTSTPEPATMAMFALGTLGLFGLRKRQIA